MQIGFGRPLDLTRGRSFALKKVKQHRQKASLNSRVPVSTAVDPSREQGSYPGPLGLNSLHEARLITSLVEYYGWTLCTDGNLYNPNPSASQLRGDAA